MEEFIEGLNQFLDKVAPLLYIVIPAAAGIWYKLKTKVKAKEDEVNKANQTKAKELYDVWEHEESKNVITKIKNFCNLYKDKGAVDLVSYLQFENGTMATSKIQNMFLTCLAEDDRYGRAPKLIKSMQRMPYSECSVWLEKLKETLAEGHETLQCSDVKDADYNRTVLETANGKVRSAIIAPVFDPNEIMLGICVFLYHDANYNNSPIEHETEQVLKFKGSVENTLFVYHQSRAKKKQQLGVQHV